MDDDDKEEAIPSSESSEKSGSLSPADTPKSKKSGSSSEAHESESESHSASKGKQSTRPEPEPMEVDEDQQPTTDAGDKANKSDDASQDSDEDIPLKPSKTPSKRGRPRKSVASVERSKDKDDPTTEKDRTKKIEETPGKKTPAKASEEKPAKAPSKQNKSPKEKEAMDETVFECGKCNGIFTSLEMCNEHMSKEHNVSMVSVNDNFICSKAVCGYKCGDADTLRAHVFAEHPQLLPKAELSSSEHSKSKESNKR